MSFLKTLIWEGQMPWCKLFLLQTLILEFSLYPPILVSVKGEAAGGVTGDQWSLVQTFPALSLFDQMKTPKCYTSLERYGSPAFNNIARKYSLKL